MPTDVDETPAPPASPSPALAPSVRRRTGTDRFDEAIVVTRTRAWVGLSACLALVAAIAVWSVRAQVGVTVSGTGVALSNGAIAVVTSPATGVVQTLTVTDGATVVAGQVVGTVTDAQQNAYQLVAPTGGVVLDVNESVGSTIQAGGAAVSIAQSSGPMQVKVFLAPAQAQQVAVGTSAILAFPGRANISGTVVHVEALPLTADQVANSIGSDALASLLVTGSAVVPVTIAPEPASADTTITTGDVATVTLIIGNEHPISYIF